MPHNWSDEERYKLIELVRNRPYFYDKCDPDHKDKDLKVRGMEEIGGMFDPQIPGMLYDLLAFGLPVCAVMFLVVDASIFAIIMFIKRPPNFHAVVSCSATVVFKIHAYQWLNL